MLTRLIERADEPEQQLTVNAECDAMTAMARGLAEYLGQQTIVMNGGREVRFHHAFYNWAELEENAEWPSIMTYALTEGQYGLPGEEAPMTPTLEPIVAGQLEKDNCAYFLKSSTELTQTYTVEAWCNDDEERIGAQMILERALFPPTVDWMNGFNLELPHYFNLRCTFEPPSSVTFIDSDGDATSRIRKAQVTIRGRVCVAQVVQRVRLTPRADLTVT